MWIVENLFLFYIFLLLYFTIIPLKCVGKVYDASDLIQKKAPKVHFRNTRTDFLNVFHLYLTNHTNRVDGSIIVQTITLKTHIVPY